MKRAALAQADHLWAAVCQHLIPPSSKAVSPSATVQVPLAELRQEGDWALASPASFPTATWEANCLMLHPEEGQLGHFPHSSGHQVCFLMHTHAGTPSLPTASRGSLPVSLPRWRLERHQCRPWGRRTESWGGAHGAEVPRVMGVLRPQTSSPTCPTVEGAADLGPQAKSFQHLLHSAACFFPGSSLSWVSLFTDPPQNGPMPCPESLLGAPLPGSALWSLVRMRLPTAKLLSVLGKAL